MKTCSCLVLLALAVSAASALAFSPVITKLHGRASTSLADDAFGRSVAMNHGWIVVGQPGDDDVGDGAGATHVYDIKGRYYRKLKASDGASGDRFGAAVALWGTLIAVGAPEDDDGATGAGSVYLFSTTSAATSKHLLKITAPSPAMADNFGASIAFSGKYLVVGAPKADRTQSDSGCIYVYEVKPSLTGPAMVTFLREVHADTPAAGDQYGFSIAAYGRTALVGAPFRTPGNPAPLQAGAVYLLDLETGGEINEISAPDGQAGDGFGWSVATNGSHFLVGAPNATANAVKSGKAYLFTVNTSAFDVQLAPLGGSLNDHFGRSVALGTHLALVGAPDFNTDVAGVDSGMAAVYEIPDGSLVAQMTVPALQSSDQLGGAVALFENLALVSAELDDDQAQNSGAVYLIDPVNGKLPLRTIVRKGDFAEGVVGGIFGNPKSAALSPTGSLSLTSLIGGLGSLGGSLFGGVPAPAPISPTDTGVWSDMSSKLDLLMKSKDVIPGGVKIGGVSNPLFNQSALSVFQAKLSGGTGVTTASNQMILGDDGSSVTPLLRTGVAIGGLGNAAVSAFQQIIQPMSAVPQIGVAYKLKTGPATTPVTAANDSGSMTLLGGAFASILDAVPREGNPIPNSLGMFFAQSMGRVCASQSGFSCMASYIKGGSTAPTQAVLTNNNIFGWTTAFFQNHPAFGAGGSSYGALLGETLSTTGNLLYRTTLTGLNTTTKNNEGLFMDPAGLFVRKGDLVEPGVSFFRFLKFWPAPNGQAVFLASLSGTGISPANDTALFLRQENGTFLQLLREGSPVGTADGAVVSAISSVDVDPFGGYYVALATLSKCASNVNQGLFTGCTNKGDANARRALRMPALRLRKGAYYQARPGAAAKILSLALSATVTDQTGAGGKGLAQIVNANGQTTVTVQFDNKVTEVMLGTP